MGWYMIHFRKASNPVRNHDFFASSMGFSSDSLVAHGFGCASIGPCHGEGDDNKQGSELVWIGDVGILDIKAAGLCIGEQALNPPSPTIKIKAAPGVFKIRHNDEQFAFPDTFGAYVQPVFTRWFHPL